MRKPETLEVISPPFPLDEDNAWKLYDRLRQLAEWFAYYRGPANKHAGRECVPSHRAVAPLAEHVKLPISRLSTLFWNMRKLREVWDSIVRLHEGNWNSDAAQLARHSLLHDAHDVLDMLYMSEEMIEARVTHRQEQQHREQLRRQVKQLDSLRNGEADDAEGDHEAQTE